jgi:hypothetical protein
MSKEHIFGDWLRPLFPRDAGTIHTHGIITWPLTGPKYVAPTLAAFQRQGHSGSKKVRVVCKPCNEGWLSNDIENVAKSVLIPLIRGRAGIVNHTMQRIISTWATKTAMTAEHVDPDKSVIHQAERTWLKDNLLPPHGWHIWAVAYGASKWRDLGIFQHLGRLKIPSVDNCPSAQHNLELTMIGMGHLMLLVISSSWARIWDILPRIAPSHIAQLWPLSGRDLSWPTPAVFSDAEAEYFTTYLSRVLDQRV